MISKRAQDGYIASGGQILPQNLGQAEANDEKKISRQPEAV